MGGARLKVPMTCSSAPRTCHQASEGLDVKMELAGWYIVIIKDRIFTIDFEYVQFFKTFFMPINNLSLKQI